MREVRIYHEAPGSGIKRMIGALWVRGRIEISENGVIGGEEGFRQGSQLCLTLDGKVTYAMADPITARAALAKPSTGAAREADVCSFCGGPLNSHRSCQMQCAGNGRD